MCVYCKEISRLELTVVIMRQCALRPDNAIRSVNIRSAENQNCGSKTPSPEKVTDPRAHFRKFHLCSHNRDDFIQQSICSF